MMEIDGRKVVDIEIDGVDSRDYPEFCDAYISGAVFEDTGEPLTYEQLEDLTKDYPEEVNEMAYESLF